MSTYVNGVKSSSQVDQFLESLISFDKENIHPNNLAAEQPYLDNPEFDPEFIRSKSLAAAGLCAWCVNIVAFYRVFCDVEPKRKALAAANAQLADAQTKLSKIKAKIKVSTVCCTLLRLEYMYAKNLSSISLASGECLRTC